MRAITVVGEESKDNGKILHESKTSRQTRPGSLDVKQGMAPPDSA